MAEDSRSLVDVKREFLMDWHRLDMAKTSILYRVPQMTDAEVEAAYVGLTSIALNMDRLDDLITSWPEDDS